MNSTASSRHLRIYLSSTFEDLVKHRQAVSRAVSRLGHDIGGMEFANAQEARPLEHARKELANSDVYLGVLAHRYGYIPTEDNPEQLSVTQLEYQEARKLGMPCFIYLLSDDVPWPVKFVDSGAPQEKLKAFRDEVSRNHLTGTFTTPDDLASQVVVSLSRAERTSSILNDPALDAQREFDVFLSYNSIDRAAVRNLALRLQRDGIRVWMDMTSLEAGDDWDRVTQSAVNRSSVVVVFLGPKGIGIQQDKEVRSALERMSESAAQGFRLIPVLLPGATEQSVPPFLSKYYWIDFRDSLDNAESYDRLKTAILGKRPAPVPQGPVPIISDEDLRLLPELLFRIVARLRERPELLQSLEPAAFWSAVRQIQPEAATIEDLRSVSRQLSSEAAPGVLWAAWVRNTRAAELAALLHNTDLAKQR